MAEPQSLLVRLLNTPDIEKVVPHLQPEVLHRVIQHCGLEDCADIVALVTPRQLERVLDVDVWRAPPGVPGGDEVFDADRFGLWLEVLMQAGAEVAAEKVAAINPALVIAGLAHHVTVFHAAAAAPFTTLDGDQAGGRVARGIASQIGQYLVEARHESAWDAIVELLRCLDAGYPERFHRLMRGCVRLSSGEREPDGLHDLLEDRDQDMFDLGVAREARRDKEGYATPAQARAFLQSARKLTLNRDPPPSDPVSRAYFRTLASAGTDDGLTPGVDDVQADASPRERASVDVGAEEMTAAFDILRDAGVIDQPRALLAAPREERQGDRSPLSFLRAHLQSFERSTEELAYLANTMLAGGSVQGRAFTPQEASEAVAAVCNLGLENWPAHWLDRDLIIAFQVGWVVLYRSVCLYAAEELIGVLARLECSDRDIRMQLGELRRELKRHVRDAAPWRARNALDAIMMLDGPSWAGLLGCIDECPVLHAAAGASRRALRVVQPGDFEFISANSQIALVREFMESLPAALTGT